MTTAHRPTYHPAVGSANSGGFRFHGPRLLVHSRDLRAHTQLKTRQPGQGGEEEMKERSAAELQRQLQRREQQHREGKGAGGRLLTDGEGQSRRGPSSEVAGAPPLLTAGEGGAEEAVEEAQGLDLQAIDLRQFDDADADLSDRDEDEESTRAHTHCAFNLTHLLW